MPDPPGLCPRVPRVLGGAVLEHRDRHPRSERGDRPVNAIQPPAEAVPGLPRLQGAVVAHSDPIDVARAGPVRGDAVPWLSGPAADVDVEEPGDVVRSAASAEIDDVAVRVAEALGAVGNL